MPKPSKALLTTYRVAVATVLLLVAVLLAGTAFACARSSDEPLFSIGGRAGQTGAGENWQAVAPGVRAERADDDPVNIFTGIGRLRVPLAGEPPATVVLSLGFPYPANDLFFAEELASHVGNFRSIAFDYFASIPRGEIDENRARSKILERYNALLRLGRIETLYFADLVVLD